MSTYPQMLRKLVKNKSRELNCASHRYETRAAAPLSSTVCRVHAEVGITQVPSATIADTLFKILNVPKSHFERNCQICATMQATAIVQMIRYSGNNECIAVSSICSPSIDCPNCAPLSEHEAKTYLHKHTWKWKYQPHSR